MTLDIIAIGLVIIAVTQVCLVALLGLLWARVRGYERVTPDRPARTLGGPVGRPGVRCYQVTYAYSDGSEKVFRNCDGYHDFTKAFGQSQAPAGTRLVTRAGGACYATHSPS